MNCKNPRREVPQVYIFTAIVPHFSTESATSPDRKPDKIDSTKNPRQ